MIRIGFIRVRFAVQNMYRKINGGFYGRREERRNQDN